MAEFDGSRVYFFSEGIEEFWQMSGFPRPSRRRLDLTAELLLLRVSHEWRENLLAIVFHEHFHRFQMNNFEPWPFAERPPGGRRILGSEAWREYATESVAELLDAERTLLKDALEAVSRDSVRELLSEYLAARSLRTTGQPNIEWNEGELERVEGVAEWVGWKVTYEILGCGSDAVSRRIASNRLGTLVKGRTRFYGTGAAQAELLERLGVDWKKPVQEGRYLHDLLAEMIDIADGGSL